MPDSLGSLTLSWQPLVILHWAFSLIAPQDPLRRRDGYSERLPRYARNEVTYIGYCGRQRAELGAHTEHGSWPLSLTGAMGWHPCPVIVSSETHLSAFASPHLGPL